MKKEKTEKIIIKLNNIQKFFYNKIKNLILNEDFNRETLLNLFKKDDIDQLIENNGFLVFEYTLKYIKCYDEHPTNVYDVLQFIIDLFICDLILLDKITIKQ